METEIAIMKKLNHPNVVSMFEVLDDPSVDKLYIVMEYMKNGPLSKMILKNKSMDRELIRKYLRDIISGLSYCNTFFN